MRKIFIIIFILFACSSSYAIELKPSPIQKQIQTNLMLASNGFSNKTTGEKSENNQQQSDSFDKPRQVSLGKAVLFSALLPGLGEHYVGNRGKAKYFFAAEALTWISFITYKTYASWKEDDMIRYAAQYANAQLEDKDDTFRDMVGFYDDIEQYNTIGRVSDPDRAYLSDTPENHWHWQSEEHRISYRVIKNRSREAERRVEFIIGAMIVNRVISIIDTVRDVKRQNKKLKNEVFSDNKLKYKIDVNPLSSNSQIKVTFYTLF